MTAADPGAGRHPRQVAGVTVAGRGGQARLVDAQGRGVLELNDTALAIWDLCDGRTTVAEMVDAVVTAFPVTEAEAARDVERVVDELTRFGVLEPPAD